MKKLLLTSFTTFILLLTSCDNFLTSEEKDSVSLEYLGKGTEFQNMAQFKLVNNSNEIIEYWGYSPSSPLYDFQIRKGTNWIRYGLGWCGNGAKVNELAPNVSIKLTTSKPDSLCIWRLTFDYSIKGSDEFEIIFSEPIQN